jgi:aminoglycoside 6'-N-acetyltransferase
MVELRAMAADDLPLVASWLREPHVARWWLADITAEAELEQLSERVSGTGDQATQMLTILERGRHTGDGGRRIGWCQWYPCLAYPAEADALGAPAGDCGIDYAIGEPAAVRRGLGTQLIAALVDPDARNAASRRILERNGFSLIAVRAIGSERNDHPIAIYRLAGITDATS